MGAFLRVSCSLLRKDAWLQAEIGATFVGICGMFPEHIIAVVDKEEVAVFVDIEDDGGDLDWWPVRAQELLES
eukprot:COSAG04_NODE_7647_length_1091_cov_1102.493952_2_plen_72_part_01